MSASDRERGEGFRMFVFGRVADTDYCSDLPVIVYRVATLTGKQLQ
jgi:hypothetical protein